MAEYTQTGDYKAVNVEGIRNNEVDSGNTDRILPRQLSTGSTRGTQTVGYGNTKIDGSNNRITIGAPDGSSIGIGSIPGSITNEYGFFSLNEQGEVVLKIVNGTMYVYDLTTGKNIMQTGRLPDDTYGSVVAKTDINVGDVFI